MPRLSRQLQKCVNLADRAGTKRCEDNEKWCAAAKPIIKKEYRSMGIGTELICAICDLFIANGLKYARLEVRNSNIRAQKLYRSIGFIPCWTEKKYYIIV